MNMPVIVISSLVFIGLLIFVIFQSLRTTPHGKLNLLEAIILKFFYKPDNRFELSAPEQRAQALALRKRFPEPVFPLERVFEHTVPGPAGEIPARVYSPGGDAVLPVLVYFHGGGWVIGDLDSQDRACRKMALQANIIIVSVDYRLAPEHKFPAAFDDCYAVTEWVAQHGADLGMDTLRIAVGGDSAGGNLAAAVCLKARDADGPKINFQLLIYPGVDATRLNRRSHQNFSRGFLLSVQDIDYFRQAYANSPEDYLNPYMSPLLADNHSGLPPAFVFTAEFDPLKSEGRAYADKLGESGVEVSYKDYPGTIHAFFGLSKLKQNTLAMQDSINMLKKYLH